MNNKPMLCEKLHSAIDGWGKEKEISITDSSVELLLNTVALLFFSDKVIYGVSREFKSTGNSY